MDNSRLAPIWLAILDVYEAFVSVCQKHGLRHYLAYGSALGAVRHHGFIPWDDDLDVMMPRQDYERFLTLAEKSLPDYLRIVTWKNTPAYEQLFGKVQDIRREKVEQLEKKTGHHLPQGVFIDIFPIDGYPEKFLDRLGRKISDYAFMASRIHRTYRMRELRGVKYWAAKFLGVFTAPFFVGLRTRRDFLAYNEGRITRYSFGATRFAADAGNLLLLGLTERVFPFECYGIPAMLEFHQRMVPVPGDFDAYLRRQYGDYRQLPPEHMQVSHHDCQDIAPWRYGCGIGSRTE